MNQKNCIISALRFWYLNFQYIIVLRIWKMNYFFDWMNVRVLVQFWLRYETFGTNTTLEGSLRIVVNSFYVIRKSRLIKQLESTVRASVYSFSSKPSFVKCVDFIAYLLGLSSLCANICVFHEYSQPNSLPQMSHFRCYFVREKVWIL